MKTLTSSTFLRRVLLVDAVSSGGMGAAMLLFTPALSSMLNLPLDLLGEAGLVLIPFAAFVGYLAAREQPPRVGVWAVIVVNVIWVSDSVLLLFTGWIEPNFLGYAFVLGQAIVVGTFAQLQYVGLRKSTFVVPG